MPKNWYIPEDDDIDVRSDSYKVPVSVIGQDAHKYLNVPDYQREKVWKEYYKFCLIRNIVRGLYIPDVIVRPDANGQKWVTDGQQRLTTIVEFYQAMMAVEAGKAIPRDEEKREFFYFPLTPRQRTRFLSRPIRFTELIDVSDEIIAEQFQDLQHSVPLNPAERLNASPSKMASLAKLAAVHPFFDVIYKGRKLRQQVIQMSIYAGMIEMYHGFCEMGSSRVIQLAENHMYSDKLVFPGIEDRVIDNLDAISRIFLNLEVKSKTELIVLYQCVYFLRYLGVDLNEYESPRYGFTQIPLRENEYGIIEGGLMPWYREIQRQNSESPRGAFLSLFASMTAVKSQRLNWGRWIDDLVYKGYIQYPNEQKRNETEIRQQRLKGWIQRNGICPECNDQHVSLNTLDRHCFRYADKFLKGHCSIEGVKVDDRSIATRA
jgi:hypothetical protein